MLKPPIVTMPHASSYPLTYLKDNSERQDTPLWERSSLTSHIKVLKSDNEKGGVGEEREGNG
jgi:hypothetical protein